MWLVDARHTLAVPTGAGGRELLEVDAVDQATATVARGLRATRGDLDDLRGETAAVSETWVSDSGVPGGWFALHHGNVTQPAPEYDEAYEHYEAWRDLQDVLEERDAEWWVEQDSDEEQ